MNVPKPTRLQEHKGEAGLTPSHTINARDRRGQFRDRVWLGHTPIDYIILPFHQSLCTSNPHQTLRSVGENPIQFHAGDDVSAKAAVA
jgi:hypothetical protein